MVKNRTYKSEGLSRLFANAPQAVFIAVAGVFAFVAYCSIYAFRKPFTAGSYAGIEFWGVQFKIVLVVAQVAGYALSKFIGIRVIGGLKSTSRAGLLLGVTAVAGLSLLGFALTPYPWNAAWMFVNGLPLGMAWGLIFSYLEGRRVTEMLAAALCANFIVSSGFVKTTGAWLLNSHVANEHWMPFLAAMLFLPALLLCIWVLEHLPQPSEKDQALRTTRSSMTSAEQRALFNRYAPGLVLLVSIYLLLTIIRDTRDNFAVELWSELGYGGQAGILTTAEAPIALLALVIIGAMMFVKNNFKAFWLNHIISLLGGCLLVGSTLLFHLGLLSPLFWMMSSGLGLFLPYILFNGVLFDRLLASFHERGNVGFLMYTADSVGYLGSVAILLWRNFGASGMGWLEFYTGLCYGGGVLIALLTLASWWYFLKKKKGVVEVNTPLANSLSI